MGIDSQKLRNAFGMFATGVTVVTTLDTASQPVGFTANSFTSVSLDPALLLICMAKSSRSFAAITANSGFSVSILAQGQKSVSENFSQTGIARFLQDSWRSGPNGYPLINECSAWFCCAREQIVDAGDHIVLLGSVGDFAVSDRPPLILSQSRFLNQ